MNKVKHKLDLEFDTKIKSQSKINIILQNKNPTWYIMNISITV